MTPARVSSSCTADDRVSVSSPCTVRTTASRSADSALSHWTKQVGRDWKHGAEVRIQMRRFLISSYCVETTLAAAEASDRDYTARI